MVLIVQNAETVRYNMLDTDTAASGKSTLKQFQLVDDIVISIRIEWFLGPVHLPWRIVP